MKRFIPTLLFTALALCVYAQKTTNPQRQLNNATPPRACIKSDTYDKFTKQRDVRLWFATLAINPDSVNLNRHTQTQHEVSVAINAQVAPNKTISSAKLLLSLVTPFRAKYSADDYVMFLFDNGQTIKFELSEDDSKHEFTLNNYFRSSCEMCVKLSAKDILLFSRNKITDVRFTHNTHKYDTPPVDIAVKPEYQDLIIRMMKVAISGISEPSE